MVSKAQVLMFLKEKKIGSEQKKMALKYTFLLFHFTIPTLSIKKS